MHGFIGVFLKDCDAYDNVLGVFCNETVGASEICKKKSVITLKSKLIRAGTIHSSPNSILSQYFYANSICFAVLQVLPFDIML